MRTRIIKGSFVALCAAIFLAVFVMTNPSNVSAAENISMTVSDFTVSPSVVDEGTFVTIDYRIDATYTGTSGGYFKTDRSRRSIRISMITLMVEHSLNRCITLSPTR